MNRAELIRFLYPGIVIGPGDALDECVLAEGGITKWSRPEPPPTDDDLLAAFVPAAKAAKVSTIKVSARVRILARIPEWRQANMTARAVELVALGQTGGAEWAAMQTAWDWIKAVRAHSDALELAVLAADDPASVDIELGWPE